MTKHKVKKEVFDQVEDEVQLRIDNFLDRIHTYFVREARFLKEEELRSVCVEHPHIEADVIQATYKRLSKESFKDSINHYLGKWEQALKL